jgi:predicted  nucleic acid-binding Zn-ribbon protein
MSMRQLFQLQCLEQEIEATGQNIARAYARIGESIELREARTNLASSQAELEALNREQKAIEYSIADLTSKMTVAHESMYSGRIKNPKELQNLQHEYDTLKTQCDPLEEKVLDLMEKIEAARAQNTRLNTVLVEITGKWKQEQAALQTEITRMQQTLEQLKQQRIEMLPSIPANELSLYHQIQQMQRQAVSRVERGVCTLCRMNLSSAELQRVRNGAVVNCSNCGRLLFLE